MQEIVCAVNSQSVIDGLSSIGSATWTLSTADLAFKGFGRVRIERIRVQVEGARSNVPIEVQIQTAGLYADKAPRGGTHQLKQFVSQPTRRTFVYNPNWIGDGDRGIVVDSDIARRYKDDFFNPTVHHLHHQDCRARWRDCRSVGCYRSESLLQRGGDGDLGALSACRQLVLGRRPTGYLRKFGRCPRRHARSPRSASSISLRTAESSIVAGIG
jgi:hypothetical protein